ncbi:MAG: ADP-ribosyl-[dinitrogen reductase] hydrolase [Nitrospirae bacterium]|nr:ADP-ribosyl-[dinitrogen reductase] hydrolase [Nitrospirota bacterium]
MGIQRQRAGRRRSQGLGRKPLRSLPDISRRTSPELLIPGLDQVRGREDGEPFPQQQHLPSTRPSLRVLPVGPCRGPPGAPSDPLPRRQQLRRARDRRAFRAAGRGGPPEQSRLLHVPSGDRRRVRRLHPGCARARHKDFFLQRSPPGAPAPRRIGAPGHRGGLPGEGELRVSGVRDRALGAYLGLAVGDALGAPVEFMTPMEIRERHGLLREMVGGGWLRLRPGQVTDDTEMSLALGRALLAPGGFDLRAVAEAFAAWLRSRPADVGNTCRQGIQRFLAEGTIEAPPREWHAGNGAAMRILPVVLAALRNPVTCRARSLAQARITHNHPLSDAAVETLAEMTRRLVLGESKPAVRGLVEELVRRSPLFRFDPYPGRATGYIVDTLQTVAHFFFGSEDFETCLVGVVNRGGDADTTGALAGMLAGAAYGCAAIPERWRKTLDRNAAREIEAQAEGLLGLSIRARPAAAPQR